MGYWMRLLPIDNSLVNTRQVRRQRERLAKKGRFDSPPYSLLGQRYTSSAYMPHVGGGRYRLDRVR